MEEQVEADLRTAAEAWKKLYRFTGARRPRTPQQLGPDASLFHYTTADGLKGIIEDNCLHASSAYFLNDSSEIDYGYRVLDGVFEEFEKHRPSWPSILTVRLVRELRQMFSSEAARVKRMKSIYVACFCEDGNLLSQWRAYGQSGGYCLGITAFGEGPARAIKPEPCIYTARWVK